MNSATTRDITVSVETAFIEMDSDPDNQYFVWAYRISIENKGADTVQLMSRHWVITDAQGRVQEVDGARKTATDFLMLMHASQVVVLNPSTFSAIAAGMGTSDASLPLVHATGRMTCGLRRGRRCDQMRRV